MSDLGRAVRRTPGAVGALTLHAGESITVPIEDFFPGMPFTPRSPLRSPCFTVVAIDHAAASITIGDAQPARLPGDAHG